MSVIMCITMADSIVGKFFVSSWPVLDFSDFYDELFFFLARNWASARFLKIIIEKYAVNKFVKKWSLVGFSYNALWRNIYFKSEKLYKFKAIYQNWLQHLHKIS